MSFKGLNDAVKRRSLPLFLDAAELIQGALVVFAIRKDVGSLFQREETDTRREERLAQWKPSVHEHLLRVLHLGAVAMACTSNEGQDVLWTTDSDAVASNTTQLTALTELFGTTCSHLLPHHMGHLRCGTTQSDDGTLALEDLNAVSDLAAGATCELLSAMDRQQLFPRKGVISPLPNGLSAKSKRLSWWLAQTGQPLKKAIIVVDLGGPESDGPRATRLQFQPITLPAR